MPRPLVLAVAALQLGIPLTMLAVRWVEEGSRPVSELPASFQMYSSTAAPTYAGLDATGRLRALSVSSLPPVLRAVDTGRSVPDRLCDRDPDLVQVIRQGGTQPGAFPC